MYTRIVQSSELTYLSPVALDPCLRKHVKPLGVHILLQSYTYFIFAYIRHDKTLANILIFIHIRLYAYLIL